MPTYMATAFFRQDDQGWSETYFRDSGGTTDLAAIADFDRARLWTKRALCCGAQTTLFAQRASFTDVQGDSVLNYIELPSAGFDSEDANTALLVRLGNADNTKSKNIFFRGIADECVVDGGKFGRGFAPFAGLVDDFFTSLIENNYGWRRTDVKTEMAVDGYVFDAQNRIVFDVSTNFPPGNVGDKVVVRGKNFGAGGKSVLNRQFVVAISGNNTLRTVKPLAAFPFAGDGPVLVRRTKVVQPAFNRRYQKIVERKAGKISYSSAGRVQARARG